MRRRDLALTISITIAQADWTTTDIEAALVRRLPHGLARHAQPIANALIAACPRQYAPSAPSIAEMLPALPGFEFILQHCRKTGTWPEPDLTSPRMKPIPAFIGLQLPQIATIGELADWLLITPERLEYLADRSGRAEAAEFPRIHHYTYKQATKRSGGLRLLEAPKPGLKALQRKILNGILNKVPQHPDAFGFVPGRSCLDAAQRHAGERLVICLDLSTFFTSVHAGRVHALFRCLGYPHTVAGLLTSLTTNATPRWMLEAMAPSERSLYSPPHLPQGAPSSPALANLAAFALDRRLAGLARTIGANYSRYADDLTFSGDGSISKPILNFAGRIVRDEGFILNQAKTRVMGASTRQTVTGLTVNQHLNIPRPEFDRLKAILHHCARPQDKRLDDPGYRAQICGRIAWVETVNRPRGAKLRALLDRALDARTALR